MPCKIHSLLFVMILTLLGSFLKLRIHLQHVLADFPKQFLKKLSCRHQTNIFHKKRNLTKSSFQSLSQKFSSKFTEY